VAAGALGVAQACLDACVEFARTRRQFGQRIGNFEMIQATVADMAAGVDAARLLVYRAAWLKDRGVKATREVSIAKLFATETASRRPAMPSCCMAGVGIQTSILWSVTIAISKGYRSMKGPRISNVS